MTDCVFCGRIERGEYDDELSLPGLVAVFEPLRPVAPGHLLVLPFRHVRDAAEEPHVTGYVMEHASRLVQNFGGGASLYQSNLITSIGPDASQTVPHLHAHLTPRRPNDGLVLPWTDQRERERLATEVARYLCAVGAGHSREAVAATAWNLADMLTSTRADRDLLTSILARETLKPEALVTCGGELRYRQNSQYRTSALPQHASCMPTRMQLACSSPEARPATTTGPRRADNRRGWCFPGRGRMLAIALSSGLRNLR